MAGLSAFGTLLYSGSFSGSTAGSANTLYANVTNISLSGTTTDTIDVTAHDSTGNMKEIVPTFINPGELTLDLNYNPALAGHLSGSSSGSTVGLGYLQKQRTLQPFTLLFNSVTPVWKETFSAYVTSFDRTAPYDDKLSATATLSISGAITSGSA